MRVHRWEKVETVKMSEAITRQLITGSEAMLARFVLRKGAVVPTHSHRSEQFSIILEGALKFIIEGKELVARAGDIVELPSNVAHYAEALEETVALDVFAPLRQDWLRGDDAYLRGDDPAGRDSR